MIRRSIFSILPAALIAAALFFASGCRRDDATRNLIYECAAYRVTSDSVVTPLMGVSATDIPAPADTVTGAVSIEFAGSPMLTRLCAIGVERLRRQNASLLSSQKKLMRLWLGGALMDSAQASDSLQAMLGPDSLPVFTAEGYQWPVGGGRELWTLAAYEDYCYNGKEEWLQKICNTQQLMAEGDSGVSLRADIGLMRGGLCTDADEFHRHYPRWVNSTERFESMCLGVNAISVAARQRHGAMLTASGQSGEAVLMEAARIASAINDRLWMPAESRYSAYLYGGYYTTQAPLTDNFGQAMAMIAGVPTAEMRSALLSATPMVCGGPSDFYPSPAGTPPYNGSESWASTQALWAIAAAEAGHGSALAYSIASLMREAATAVDGGYAAEMLAAVALRALAGVKVTTSGMEFRPMIITPLDGGVTIGSLRYCNALLTINISGSGSTIAGFSIDGVATSDYKIPSTLTGSHTIDIVLANNIIPMPPLTTASQTWLPPLPEVEWTSRNEARVSEQYPATTYNLWLNGLVEQELTSPALSFDSIDRATAVSISALQRSLPGFISMPHFIMPRGAMTLLEVENFESGGTMRVRQPKVSLRFVESSRTKHPVIKVEITEPVETEALIDVCYANGNGPDTSGAACGIRRLVVNGSDCGTLVMPGRGDGWWATTAMSNTLKVKLNSGVNTISIETHGIGADPELLIDYLRIVRLHKFPVK